MPEPQEIDAVVRVVPLCNSLLHLVTRLFTRCGGRADRGFCRLPRNRACRFNQSRKRRKTLCSEVVSGAVTPEAAKAIKLCVRQPGLSIRSRQTVFHKSTRFDCSSFVRRLYEAQGANIVKNRAVTPWLNVFGFTGLTMSGAYRRTKPGNAWNSPVELRPGDIIIPVQSVLDPCRGPLGNAGTANVSRKQHRNPVHLSRLRCCAPLLTFSAANGTSAGTNPKHQISTSSHHTPAAVTISSVPGTSKQTRIDRYLETYPFQISLTVKLMGEKVQKLITR